MAFTIDSIVLRHIKMPLVHFFETSFSRTYARDIVLVEVVSDGLSGWGEVTAGLVYNPITDEMFTAERGKGAFLNERRIRVAARKRLADCVVACGLPQAPVAGIVREVRPSVGITLATQATGIPVAAAVELGFFKAEGLDMQLELIFPVNRTLEILRDGLRHICLLHASFAGRRSCPPYVYSCGYFVSWIVFQVPAPKISFASFSPSGAVSLRCSASSSVTTVPALLAAHGVKADVRTAFGTEPLPKGLVAIVGSKPAG